MTTQEKTYPRGKKALSHARKHGFIEICQGVYLNSRESIMADQKGWDEEDSCFDFDFSHPPFWVTTDAGEDPVAVDSVEELKTLINEGQ